MGGKKNRGTGSSGKISSADGKAAARMSARMSSAMMRALPDKAFDEAYMMPGIKKTNGGSKPRK